MQITHRTVIRAAAIGTTALIASPAIAQTVEVSVAIPRLTVAEYHRPYVAMWIEKEGATPRTLSVWYDFDMKDNEGTKWLRDVRQWWRVSGRSMNFPANGITGATKAPGVHKMTLTAGSAPLGQLGAGNYVLVVEAAREVGGREMLRLPFAWPPKPGQVVRAAGTSELGAVSLTFKR